MQKDTDLKADILLVDDNLNNLSILLDVLRRQKYQVRVATSGKRALAAVSSCLPDLILLDISMPEMSGYEVCKELKANTESSCIPIIFVSALDDALDKVNAFKVGGVDYVTKPFHLDEVMARIENQLKISRLQKTLETKNTELIKKNEELIKSKKELTESYNRVEQIFTAFSEILPGTVLDNKYELENRIDTGGFGAVYKAKHLGLNKSIAIKVFQPRAGNVTVKNLERFRLEGISACRINHPNAVSVLDFGISSSGIAYLAMELLEGHTLAQELSRKKVLSPERCAEILVPVCDALSEAHTVGIIHRDIKPSNIFLHNAKGKEIVKVVDFGLAKFSGETDIDLQNITVGRIVGTPTYMSPERLGNLPYDDKTDIYSLGITLYQMLCGQVPFQSKEGDICAVAVMHLTQTPPPIRLINPNISEAVEKIALRTLEKSPSNRPTAKELSTEFLKALS